MARAKKSKKPTKKPTKKPAKKSTEPPEEIPRELVSRAEYAKRRGVAPRTIGKYVQRGIIPLHGNKIDPEEATLCLERHLVVPFGVDRKTVGTRSPGDKAKNNTQLYGSKATSFVNARTREKEIKVQMLELDLKLKTGEMVMVKDVELAAFTMARKIRDRMLNIPDRVAAIVAAETDEVEVRNIILFQIENELSDLSQTYDPEGLKDGNEGNAG